IACSGSGNAYSGSHAISPDECVSSDRYVKPSKRSSSESNPSATACRISVVVISGFVSDATSKIVSIVAGIRSGTATACPSAPSSLMPRDVPTAHAAAGKLPTAISCCRSSAMCGCSHPRPIQMFRLEKLEIHGFKSFYDPANLSFPAAMTAVVGPNGCGKSNICDAIIWVLGENRAAHIRGETMDDVIFQGSARRRPLSMGEVTLTLGTSNGDSDHPMADDGRIVINRRVFRTGESEFRLNGKRVRMKDISDILMDTGLGIRNYSVMEQGKIDLILSNKPQDRRRLIEEAAGITKYKTKRRAAELKLEETQQNLLRIDDTLGEVTRNLNSLKRQAGKARRHRELTEQLSTAKRALYRGRIVAAQAEQEAAEQGVSSAQATESELSAQLATDEAELA